VQCWNNSDGSKPSIVVTVIDSCPCSHAKPDGQTAAQPWCCGDVYHFDMSFWAFERLAHPVYGVAMVSACVRPSVYLSVRAPRAPSVRRDNGACVCASVHLSVRVSTSRTHDDGVCACMCACQTAG
jgi:hypothetical protein